MFETAAARCMDREPALIDELDVFEDAVASDAAAPRLERLFERQVDRRPDAVAVEHAGIRATYAELDARANRIASALRSLGVGREVCVGILLHRSIDMVAAIIGVLKAGGAYVPLDCSYPAGRTSYMISDSGARVVIVSGGLPDGLVCAATVLDVEGRQVADAPPTRVPCGGGVRDLAYVIYTSGSSGAPKAVLLEHSLARFARWVGEAFTPEELAVSAAATSICFDPHVLEILAPLCAGGSVLLKDSPLDPFLPGERPTLIGGVPSVMAANIAGGRVPRGVLAAVVGGERLTDDLVRAMSSCGIARICNQYGPTETTVAATAAWVVPSRDGCDPGIGRAICGNVVEIVDGDGCAVPEGAAGELRISGPMLARGYGGAAADGERGFGTDPRTGRRFYRTGDIVRVASDGSIDYVGREGDFIKLNGRRIAPGEIETAMLHVPGVRSAVATLGRDSQGRDRLIAHVVEAPDHSLTLGDLRLALRVWLPHAMLPTVLHVHEALPLTLNNKVDRRALPGVPPPSPVDADPVDYKPIARAAADVFAQELGLQDVGPDDDFFELGGDSLAAVAVALSLEEVIGRSVSPALLFHAPTPRRLHEELEGHVQEACRHLVELKAGGSAPPVFCLPDLYGRPMSVITLARSMPEDQPVYGLAIGPKAIDLIERADMADLVDAYVAEIRERRPSGPYRLLGYCFGGAFAQEIARRLHDEGETTSLALIESANMVSRISPMPLAAWAVRRSLAALRREGPAWTARRALLRMRHLASYLLGRIDRGTPDWVPAADVVLAKAHHDCLVARRPGVYCGRTFMLVCRDQDVANTFRNVDGMLGWRRHLAGPVLHREVPVVHQDVVRSAYVGELAASLATFFDGDGGGTGT